MKVIFNELSFLLNIKKTVFIAIDGIPGSGKTTLSRLFKKENSSVKIIKIDNFYSSSIGNTDFERLKKEVIFPLKKGRDVNFKLYDFKTNSLNKSMFVLSGGPIIIEGIASMDRRLIDLYDYRIWVDCPIKIGLERVLARDNKKYKKQWIEEWMPKILDYVNKQKPYKKANAIVNYKDIPRI